MLPQIILDDEWYSEITEKSKKQLPGLYPEWTDYNYHDPGITMLELLSWFKELQQFHLDGTGSAHILKYLNLMGFVPLKKTPSRVEISMEGLSEQVFLPKGSRFYAGAICFETEEAAVFDTACVVKLIFYDNKVLETDVTRNKMRFPAFGMRPKNGDTLFIGLDRPLLSGQRQKLHFQFFRDTLAVRNPFEIDGEFITLAEISCSYLSEDGWKVIEDVRDSTHQMLEDGFFSFEVAGRMGQGEDGCYWLKMEVNHCNYLFPPIIETIGLHQISAVQKETLMESFEGAPNKEGIIFLQTLLAVEGGYEIFILKESTYEKYQGESRRIIQKNGVTFYFPGLKETMCRLICYDKNSIKDLTIGIGNGLPYQKYECRIPDLCMSGLEVLIETEEGSECYEQWEYKEDFFGSGPMDHHYHFDEQTGILFFGNCDRGMAPEGKIILVSGYRSLGIGGNVKANTIDRTDLNIPCWNIGNSRDAVGGTDTESLEDCIFRMKKKSKEIYRTVTYEDYEYMARKTPGLMIENVRAIPITERRQQDGTLKTNTISLVVKPYSLEERPVLNEAYRKNIYRWLDTKRMIGTRLEILSPEYIGISVYAEMETMANESLMKENVGKALTDYFDEIRSQFGTAIHYSTVYGILDVLEKVIRIKALSIDAQGKNIKRSRNGDIVLPVNGLPYLTEWTCVIL